MKVVQCTSKEDSLAKMQVFVDLEWHRNYPKKDRRRWLKCIPEDSYTDPVYRIELWVLEGSPIKQMVIINHYAKTICVYSFGGKRVACFYWCEFQPDFGG